MKKIYDVRPLYELLARSPDLAIAYNQPSTIQSKMIDGNVFAPVVVKGTAAVYMVDSGMNLSMMSESEAARLHLTPQSIETRMSDISGKVSPSIRIVEVDELTVGATNLRHVPFLVVLAANVLHAVTDLLLVNIQSDVIHRSHEEPPWCL
jgi:Aspartyl protease